MLKLLRKNTKYIIWSVVVCFMLWGGLSVGLQFSKKGRYAGELFGKNISFQEFNRFYQSNLYFNPVDANKLSSEQLRQQTWDRLMLNREAKRENIQVSDDEVRNEIKRLFAQGDFANLTEGAYKAWLQRTFRMQPRQFEELLREMLRIQKLIQIVHSYPVDEPTDEEILTQALLEREKGSFEEVLLKNFQETKLFSEAFEKENDWKAALTKTARTATSLTNLTRSEFQTQTGLSAGETHQIFSHDTGTITAPFPVEEQYAIFYISNKQSVPADNLTDDEKQKIGESIKVKKREAHIVQWHIDVVTQARFKDFQTATTPAS